MRHDGPLSDNNCDPGSYLMSPTLGSGKITWSSCSRHYLDLFLRTPQSFCLMDHSGSVIQLDHNKDNSLPGERFDTDQQCMLKYGRGSVHSADQALSEICRDLHCMKDTHSFSSHPALEGTNCGVNKWCQGGRCVDRSLSRRHISRQPMAGGWSEWSQFSECASGCLYGDKGTIDSGSTGVMVSFRLCNNPWPENGGEPCTGSDKKFRTCLSNQCENISKTTVEDFAHEICLRARDFDRELDGTGLQKISSNPEDSCLVWCHKTGGGLKSKGWTFPDGTTCQTHKQAQSKYCIEGVCQEFKCFGGASDIYSLSQEHCSSSTLFPRDKRRQVNIGTWQSMSDCFYNCIIPGRGLRLVEKKMCYNCNTTTSIQLCQPKKKACSLPKTTTEMATLICSKYKNRVRRLSGFGMQLSPSIDDPDRACRLACQDETISHRFYLVNGEDGWFPFGTDCSRGDTTKKSFCLSGSCLEFGPDDLPIHGSSHSLPVSRTRYRRSSERSYCGKVGYSTDFSVDYENPIHVHLEDIILYYNHSL